MNILITGGNGFLGRNLISQIRGEEHNLLVTYNKNTEYIPAKISKISSDLIEEADFNPDIIFHLASYIPHRNAENVGSKLEKSNVDFTKRLLNRFPEAKCIFSSSVSVYEPVNHVIDEFTETYPISAYGVSKIKGENLVKNFKDYAIIRFSSLYGQGMVTNTIVPALINAALSKNEITLIGDGQRQQDYLFVQDAVAMLLKAIDVSGIFLGVNGNSRTNMEVAKIISNYTGATISSVDGDQGPSFRYNNEISKRKLKITETVELESGIKAML